MKKIIVLDKKAVQEAYNLWVESVAEKEDEIRDWIGHSGSSGELLIR